MPHCLASAKRTPKGHFSLNQIQIVPGSNRCKPFRNNRLRPRTDFFPDSHDRTIQSATPLSRTSKSEMKWVWLLYDDAPLTAWVKSLLVSFHVKRPVTIEVSAQIDGSQLDDGLGHRLGPTHARSLHAIFDQILASTFDGAAGDRPALGQVLVIAHPSAVAV